MRPVRGIRDFGPPAPGSATALEYSGRLVKTCNRPKHIEPKVTDAEWLTALLVAVMMLQDYTRLVPFPQDAPGHSADFAGNRDQFQCPRRLGLVVSISRNRPFSNGYRQTTEFGHCM